MAAGCSESEALVGSNGSTSTLLVGTGEQVAAIDTEGRPNLVLSPEAETPHAIELSQAMDKFAAVYDDHVTIQAGDGAMLGQVRTQAPGRRHRFWGEHLLVPIVSTLDPHTASVVAYEARTVQDQLRVRIDAPNARFTRPTPGHLVVVGADDISRYDLRGRTSWKVNGTAIDLATASATDRQVFVDADDSRRLVFLADGRELGRVELRSPIWALAMDEDGRFSAATTARRLYVFETGHLVAGVRLDKEHGLRYATSLVLTTRGVLVGGQTPEGAGRVLLLGHTGRLLESWQLEGMDHHGFRPLVRVLGDRSHFSVEHAGRLQIGSLDGPSASTLQHLDVPRLQPDGSQP